MKRIILLLLLIISLESCSKKNVKLPETHNLDITEIKDVSPAYVFYDETKKDSVELNRKNLIITTNWLVNVDKRLTLRQAIPSITFLQNKKRNAKMHKNENAKNYFTGFNPDIKNLAFIEFTDVVFKFIYNDSLQKEKLTRYNILSEPQKAAESIKNIAVSLDLSMEIAIKIDNKETTYIFNEIVKKNKLLDRIKNIVSHNIVHDYLISFYYNENLTFQDYISYKSLLLKLDLENVMIDNNEFIYN
jgi:hypothetical protein